MRIEEDTAPKRKTRQSEFVDRVKAPMFGVLCALENILGSSDPLTESASKFYSEVKDKHQSFIDSRPKTKTRK